MSSLSRSRTSRIIKAPREAVYGAFINPQTLSVWLAPGMMTGRILDFDARVGGGYRMSLSYPSTDCAHVGKSSEREDRFSSRFVELQPLERIVQMIQFDTSEPAFSGEMRMEVTLEDRQGDTLVTIAFENIPPGISPEDNDTGTRLSLEKLARYLE